MSEIRNRARAAGVRKNSQPDGENPTQLDRNHNNLKPRRLPV
jgi:hypothetical protein